MYKLVAIDMDGTLLDSDKQISARTKQAISKAREQGVVVVLASGRPLEGMMSALQELEMTTDQDYVLSYNGSEIHQVASKTKIRDLLITGKDAKAIANQAEQLGVHVHAFSPTRGLITPCNNTYTQHEATINQVEIHEFDFLQLEDDEPIIKTMIVDEPEKLSAAIKQLPEALTSQFTVVRSAPFFLEFLNPQSNKGTAVAMLAEHLGIDAEHVVCMGDAGNDLHMVKYAGLGVAMANAMEEVKAVADYITDTNDQDGVAKVFERFVF